MKILFRIFVPKLKGKNEMNFDFKSLQSAEKKGQKIGNWNGAAVYAVSKYKLDNFGNGAYFIVYDDDNVIVKRNRYDEWVAYGWVSERGTVSEYNEPRKYKEKVKPEAVKSRPQYYHEDSSSSSTPGGSYSPGYEVDERPTGDVRLEADVEATLKKARELSVNDLLEGFHFGIEDFCVHGKAKG